MIVIYMGHTLDYAVSLNPDLIEEVIKITTSYELKSVNGVTYYKTIYNGN